MEESELEKLNKNLNELAIRSNSIENEDEFDQDDEDEEEEEEEEVLDDEQVQENNNTQLTMSNSKFLFNSENTANKKPFEEQIEKDLNLIKEKLSLNLHIENDLKALTTATAKKRKNDTSSIVTSGLIKLEEELAALNNNKATLLETLNSNISIINSTTNNATSNTTANKNKKNKKKKNQKIKQLSAQSLNIALAPFS